MADEDVVAGIWHSLLTRLSNDSRVTRQMIGFLSLVEPVATLGETLYVDVPNDLTKAMIEQRILGIRRTIGRADTNQLVLPDPDRAISRVHAQIVFRNGRWQSVVSCRKQASTSRKAS